MTINIDEYKPEVLDRNAGKEKHILKKRLIEKHLNEIWELYNDYDPQLDMSGWDMYIEISIFDNEGTRFYYKSESIEYDKMIYAETGNEIRSRFNAIKATFNDWIRKIKNVILTRELEDDLVKSYADKYRVCFDRTEMGNFRSASLVCDAEKLGKRGVWFYERMDYTICTVGFRNIVSIHYADQESIKKEFEIIKQAFEFAVNSIENKGSVV